VNNGENFELCFVSDEWDIYKESYQFNFCGRWYFERYFLLYKMINGQNIMTLQIKLKIYQTKVEKKNLKYHDSWNRIENSRKKITKIYMELNFSLFNVMNMFIWRMEKWVVTLKSGKSGWKYFCFGSTSFARLNRHEPS